MIVNLIAIVLVVEILIVSVIVIVILIVVVVEGVAVAADWGSDPHLLCRASSLRPLKTGCEDLTTPSTFPAPHPSPFSKAESMQPVVSRDGFRAQGFGLGGFSHK